MTKDWLSIQDEACQLHANRYTLDEIKAALYERHKSEASTRAWRLKSKQWGIKHRTANTSRIQKTTKSHRRKPQVPEKLATAKAPASISLDPPVLRYFKDKQVNEDTKYLDDLDEAGQWNSLAQEFVAQNYGDETTAICYEHLGKFLELWYRRLNPSQIRQAFDQVRKKAFWDIMRNRTKVLQDLYRFLRAAGYYFFRNDIDDVLFEPCVERNEFCAHSTECRSVASAMLLHTKDQNVPGYWDTLYSMEQPAKLILRAWTAGDLRDPERFFERYIDSDPSDIVNCILEVIPDEHSEVQIKTAEIVAAKYDQYDLFISDLILNLRALHTTQTPLKWRLAEIIIRYPGAKPVDYLERLSSAFSNFRRDMRSIDLTKPSSSVADTIRSGLGDPRRVVYGWSGSSDAEKHQILSFFIHVITKAWLDLVLQDDTGNLELSVSDILGIREDFGGLPELRLSVDATALGQMAGAAFLKSLRPKVLGWESEDSSDFRQYSPEVGVAQPDGDQPITIGEDRASSQAAEVQVISSDEDEDETEDEDEDEDMPDRQPPRNADQQAHELEDAQG